MWLVALIWAVNMFISWSNATVVGRTWAETKAIGGWPRFMSWMGAIMAASGFSWCFLIVLALGAHQFYPKYFPEDSLQASLSLGYVLLIPGILMSGLAITIDSWGQAYRSRRLGDMALAGWNTYAQIHNTYNAITTFGEALGNVFDFFGRGSSSSSDSDDDNGGGAAVILVIALVAIALFGGILLTAAIIKKNAGTTPLLRN